MVGPGAVAPYSGGGGRPRGFGYVRDPAAGFFVTGSTIRGLNGVYRRVNSVPEDEHRWQLVYKHQSSGWLMGLAEGRTASGGAQYETVGGKETEWLFCDDEQQDRFGHVGNTVIPGAGPKWSHLHRRASGIAPEPSNPPADDEGAPAAGKLLTRLSSATRAASAFSSAS